ncbi:MAG: hypothetical protein HC880_05160 [Bacteroidia bacterium]|nr:hypothetical protein [Bacteroidia bacterium]
MNKQHFRLLIIVVSFLTAIIGREFSSEKSPEHASATQSWAIAGFYQAI